MKKILILLATALLCLTGCTTDSHTSVNNANETIVTIGEKTYTRGDLYKFMLANGGGYQAILDSQKLILDAEVPVTDEMTASAEATIDSYRSMFGESFEAYLQSMGIASEETYLEELVISEQSNALNTLYIDANYDSLVTRYSPKQYQIMQFTDVEVANTALAAVQGGEDFTAVATGNGSALDSTPKLATTQSTLDTNILYALENLEVNGVSEVFASTDGANQYIVKLVDNDPTNLKDAFIADLNAGGTLTQEVLLHYFNEYGFNIYDADIYSQVKTNYTEFLPESK